MARINYNERSWAIDVISEINLFLSNKSWHFKAAGGESTISYDKRSLFPDVLLFKDNSKNIITQGWELKMPDTEITDSELISNAIKKAKILKRDSFVLWNVKTAVLYHKIEDDFKILKSWDDIDISLRSEVKEKEQLWKELLFKILTDLNNYFESGEIIEVSEAEILSIDDVIDVVLENTLSTTDSLKSKIKQNTLLEAEINQWWNSSYGEYGFTANQTSEKLPTLSMVVLTDWVFKITFAHILKRHFNEAKEIESIQIDTSIDEAIDIMQTISENCDFWNIFSPNTGQNAISEVAWSNLKELSLFLTSINIEAIDIEILHELLQSSVASAKRKVAGQFSTPKKLAELLNRLTLNDKTKIVLDPCCGTGTIINQAYQLKEEYELNQEEILNSIWASDKHSFPIQLSTLSMANPSNIGRIINIFKADIINLEKGKIIEFRNPNDGQIVQKELPEIDYVVSNLPFIKSKEMKVLNPEIVTINNWIQEQTDTTLTLSGKSDIFAYIPFYLYQILSEEGKIGLILSNAWMGTDYGEVFLKIFRKFYTINYVLISGKGRWFNNADVVTTILIASKRNLDNEINTNHEVSFCTLKEKIENIDDVKTLSENILLSNETETLTINNYSLQKIAEFEEFGVPWSGYFSNLSWLGNVKNKLINTEKIFHFTRGERRGWNPMFYPTTNHNIEQEYIKPVLKHLRNTTGLVCKPNAEAFCCSKTIDELETLGHNGAITWIRSFENQRNGTNRPLPEVLAKPNMFWYEMKTENMADFVANVNYDRSLFIAKFENRSFIDQRMIGFSVKDEFSQENKILFLALLNSTISMFLIESFGFGRGLGALDLRATKFERDFKILNPNTLTEEQKNEIITAFTPLLERDRLPLLEELEAEDRIAFETLLMEIYGISEYYAAIKKSLKELYQIRFAVKA
ncbi:MAG: SAM-dependent DNA methyltransferase [Chlorobi bacterium]|nr:SAM-dependent DNA methyltransferase [Ignavibacteriota bacterium]MBL1161137.1 SAM-dependent DNA methyltransferase [Chlorobiota bacterium]NOG67606.1 SAM-dependent DNA methyltransferase [Chlorobiota bacterium]